MKYTQKLECTKKRGTVLLTDKIRFGHGPHHLFKVENHYFRVFVGWLPVDKNLCPCGATTKPR